MPEILSIGRLQKTDAEGFLINESNLAKVGPPWKDAVEDIKQAYLSHAADVIHSIYLRGTVSRGEAVEGISDIDTFAVITKKPEEIDRSWVKEVHGALEQKYRFTAGVEIDFISHRELFEGDELFNDRFTIKTQSACIYGEDLAHTIEPFRADFDTASRLRPDLKKVIENAAARVDANPSKESVRAWCRWAMKRIVRAGCILVMDEERAFTRDLYPCYAVFSKYYPEQEENMRTALELAIHPTDDPKKLAAFLATFGNWMENALAQKFHT